MSDPGALLAALQLADSAFPIGGFTQSYGLETAVAEGRVRRLVDVERYVEALLCQVATLDLAAAVLAYRQTDDLTSVAAIDRALLARKLVREPREASRRAGQALLRAATAVGARDVALAYRDFVVRGHAPGLHPIVHGLVAAAIGLSEQDAALTHAHGLVLSVVNASIRLLPIDHLDVQAIVRQARPEIVAAVSIAHGVRDVDALHGFAPELEILSMRHERGQARAFAT